MLEKQKGGNFLTEILGVLYCEAIASFLLFFEFESFFLSNLKNNKKTVCASAPAAAVKAACAENKIF